MRLDEIRALLPELDELRPVVDLMIATSEPDRSRAWSGSGKLGTLGSRQADTNDLPRQVAELAAAEAQHLSAVYGAVARALTLASEDDAPGAATAFLEAAGAEEARNRPERAEAYARAAHMIAREGPDRGVEALALRRWARAARARGRLDEALTRYSESHDAEVALSRAREAAEAAVGAGNVLEEQGRWDAARRWYETALRLVVDEDGPVPERLHALFNLHVVTRSAGDPEGSLVFLDRAAREAEEVDPVGALPFLENARGQLCMAEGSFDEAVTHLVRAADAAADARARVTIRLNLAEALLALGRTLDSAEQCREAEREAIGANLIAKLPEVYRLLGRIATEEGEADAFVLFERALDVARERGPALEEALTLQAYAASEARLGNRDTSRALEEASRARFEELGIHHSRQEWADVYAAEGEVARDAERVEERDADGTVPGSSTHGEPDAAP